MEKGNSSNKKEDNRNINNKKLRKNTKASNSIQIQPKFQAKE